MNQRELNDLILQMRQIGNDTQTCEVKESRKKIPENITDTLSAFSNGEGGTIILGVSEKKDSFPWNRSMHEPCRKR